MLARADDAHAFRQALKCGEGIPLIRDFDHFQKHSDAKLFASLQKMASDLWGQRVPMGWDNVDFSAIDTWSIIISWPSSLQKSTCGVCWR